MILTIGKPAAFDDHGLPVRGQTQPYQNGWRLRAFHRGEETLLLEGTYYICRQVQIACAGKSAEELPAVVERMKDELAQDLQETAALQPATEPDLPASAQSAPPPPPSDGHDEQTVALPKEEIDEMRRRRRKDFRF